ncbi:hypothetical protein MPSEU_000611000 [Mayamaea pseudoterrestris]|nr:hypothetical protein MPSEU_000611000 [Mayamaea pseudoterrestris]
MLPQQVLDYIERPRFLYAAVFIWMTVTAGCFLSPFLEHLGLNQSEIGIALSIARLVDMIGNGTAGAWADHRERMNPKQGRAQVIALGIIGASFATLCHGWATRAWQHIALRSIYSGFASLITVVLDGMTIDYLGEKRRADYGKERLHGAIWWAMAHWGFSILVENIGFRAVYLMTMITGPAMLSCLFIYVIHQQKLRPTYMKRSSDIIDDLDDLVEQEQQTYQTTTHYASLQITERPVPDKPELTLRSLAGLLLSSLPSIAFFTAAFCLAIGQSVADNFSFLFFETLGSTYTIMGWTIILTIAFEVPVFQVAPKLLKRFGSRNMLLLACSCYIVRVVGYSYVPEGHGWMVLLFEPLHGITYACTQTAIVDFVAQLMPPGYQASGQGLAQSFRGLGGILGVGVGGFVVQANGDRFVYRIVAVIVAFGAIFFFGCKCLEEKNDAETSLDGDEDDDNLSVSTFGSERQPLKYHVAEP